MECMTLAEIFATTIFSVKLMHDCITVVHDFNGLIVSIKSQQNRIESVENLVLMVELLD